MRNGTETFYGMKINDQKAMLDKFDEPKDLLERSYYQYLCQMKQLPLLLKIAQSLTAIILTPYYYFNFFKKCDNNTESHKKVAVLLSGIIDISYVPISLYNEFDEIISFYYSSNNQLSVREKKVIKQIYKRYWYKPYFCLKCMMKIALYAFQIRNYSPYAILTAGEFSFTSSALTFYCRAIGVEHINIMHGEKLYNIHDSFVSFDRYYVWDQHYIDLLVSMGADENQFIIEEPNVLRLKNIKKKKYDYALTYYLGGESKNDLIKIRESLVKTDIPSEKICVRYHPRFFDEKRIRKIFNRFKIENPHEVALEESLSKTKYVVSLYSTVLHQAYISGKEVVIDDVSNHDNFKKLKEMKYIMISKPHVLLSDVIKRKYKLDIAI